MAMDTIYIIYSCNQNRIFDFKRKIRRSDFLIAVVDYVDYIDCIYVIYDFYSFYILVFSRL